MTHPLKEFDNFIHQEMLVHPALFTHVKAHSIAIIDTNDGGIATEVLKHNLVQDVCQITSHKPANPSSDPRLKFFVGNSTDWLTKVTPESFDIIIIPEHTPPSPPGVYQQYLNALRSSGILIQQCDSLFDLPQIKSTHLAIQDAGFQDVHVLHYPQPNYPSGWRAATMAIKQGHFHRVREKDIFNKQFVTRYYNFDIHKASFVLPEFMREALAV